MVAVYRAKPPGFIPKVKVAACYLQLDNKLLLLRRASDNSEAGSWGVPAGKLEQGENPSDGAVRELYEETGLQFPEKDFTYLGVVYVCKPNIQYEYHMFLRRLESAPQIHLNNENCEYRWVEFEEIAKMPLMAGAMEILEHFKALLAQDALIRRPFYFIRHGETDANIDLEKERLDDNPPLNPKGISQATAARDSVEKLEFGSACFSPFLRAVETKNILLNASNLKQHELFNLRECSTPTWYKMVRLEEGSGYHVCDQVREFLSRTIAGVNQALQTSSTPLIIAHGGIHWALCYHMAIENHPWKIGNCELVYFEPVGQSSWKANYLF